MINMRMVIGLLGAALLLCISLIGLLAVTGHQIPDVLQNVTVGALTGLAGVLARKDTPE